MEMDIITSYCMALECAEIYSRFLTGSSFMETKNKLLMRYGAEYSDKARADFDHLFEQLDIIYTQTIHEIPENEDRIFFFKQFYNGNVHSSLGYIMLVNFLDIHASTVADYIASAKKRAKEMLDSKVHISDVVYSAMVLTPSEDGSTLRENLHKDIDKLSYDSDFKWKLFMVLSEFDFYADRLESLLSAIEENLLKRLHKLDKICLRQANIRMNSFTDSKIEELAVTMNLPETEIRSKKVLLCILCMPCHQLIMDEQWNDTELPMFLGIAAEWGNDSKESIDKSMICEALRIIGEESKFEILQLLSNTVMCSKEIAEKTGLDVTTVSRHIAALTKYDLIEVEHKEKRYIYYRTKAGEVAKLMELVKEALR